VRADTDPAASAPVPLARPDLPVDSEANLTRCGTIKRGGKVKHRKGSTPKPVLSKYQLAAVQMHGAWNIINRNTNETLREGIDFRRACDVVSTQLLR